MLDKVGSPSPQLPGCDETYHKWWENVYHAFVYLSGLCGVPQCFSAFTFPILSYHGYTYAGLATCLLITHPTCAILLRIIVYVRKSSFNDKVFEKVFLFYALLIIPGR